MRSALRKEVFANFEKGIAARLPQFELVSRNDALMWAWKINPVLTFFVFVDVVDNKDQFFLEIAWSETGDFPWKSLGKVKVDRENGRLRLGAQWQAGKSYLWDLTPEKTEGMKQHLDALRQGKTMPYPADPSIEHVWPRTSHLVHDCIDKLEIYGVPLLQQVAEVRGLTWPAT